ncbi:hypothetical protein [Eggerthia catenaformis]|uniref:hypothetical protein n=1 Tax=Eggerthia catenaformis TaxID=31973 RepID=UPI00248F3D35|nr:hypothetical protein [Eggerthia catenaformis]
MKKKYREMRHTIVMSILLIALMGAAVYGAYVGSKTKLIVGLAASVICMLLLLFASQIIIDDTYLVTYDYYVFINIPRMIYYRDIKEIKQINRYCLDIYYKNKHAKMYVFNSNQVLKDYNEIRSKKSSKVI